MTGTRSQRNPPILRDIEHSAECCRLFRETPSPGLDYRIPCIWSCQFSMSEWAYLY